LDRRLEGNARVILVLCENGTQHIGDQIVQQLQSAYDMPSPPQLVRSDATWNRSPEWDDLLIVVYCSAQPPRPAQDYIIAFRNAHKTTDSITKQQRPSGFVVPVAVDPAYMRPPPPISGIEAVLFRDDPKTLKRIVDSVGVMLGVAVRPGSQRIFISYRKSDGEQIARDIHQRLENDGFEPWLDEAKENINIGDDVQQQIHDHVKDAAVMLLVDTPGAPESAWVFEEIEVAVAQLVLVVPVVIGDTQSRFDHVASLRRKALVKPGGLDGQPLADTEWQSVRATMDEVLLSGYRRRLLLLSRAERAFRENGYDWSVLDQRMRMYKANRKQPLPLAVLSHCSIHDITWMPALKAFADYIAKLRDVADLNFKLCLYDREKSLSQAETQYIYQQLGRSLFYPTHHNELGLLLLSNFARMQ
jgi:hypothetical protein